MPLVPTGARTWYNTSLERNAGMIGAGRMPANYLDDDGETWRDIALEWEQVDPARWRAVRAGHRLAFDTSLGFQFSKRDTAGVWHSLGMQPRAMIKFNPADKTWDVIAQSQSPSAAEFSGGNAVLRDVFPDVDLRLEYFNDSVTLQPVFTQAARDALAGEGPWENRMIGIATELDLSGLNLTWRDAGGDFDPSSTARFHAGWMDAHLDGARVWALAKSEVQHAAYDPFAAGNVPVHKFVAQRNGKVWLIELFDAVAASQLPAGDIWHNATFGNETAEASNTGFGDKPLSLGATPGSSGTADSISAYAKPTVSFGNTLRATCYLYDVEPFGSSAIPTDERTWTLGTPDYAWITFDFSTAPDITSGVKRYIAGWSDTPAAGEELEVKAASSGGDNYWTNEIYDRANPPDLDSSNALKLSIYCTYTETAPAGPPLGTHALMGVGR